MNYSVTCRYLVRKIIILYVSCNIFITEKEAWRSGDCTRLPPTWAGFGPRVG